MLICKDLLDSGVRDLVTHLAVNVLLVPAMSERTEPFGSAIEDVVARTQGVVMLANGPLCFGGHDAGPAAFLGQPVEDERVREARPADGAPDVTRFVMAREASPDS